MSNFHDKPNQFINHIVLKVEDINRSKEFYTKIIGFTVLKEDSKQVSLSVDGLTALITLVQPKNVIKKLPNKTGMYHFAILLPKRTDLGLFLKNIVDKDYPISGGSNHGVSEALYLEDVDHNGIEIYVDTDPSTWRWQDKHVNMTSSRLDVNDMLAEVNAKEWNGLPKDTKIGHIHLSVADLNAAKRFYEEGLGYNLVSSFSNQAYFFSTGGYHHHVAVNVWNGKNALPLAKNSVGIKYFSIMLEDEKKRQEIVDNLIKLGYKVTNEKEGIFTQDPSDNKIQLSI